MLAALSDPVVVVDDRTIVTGVNAAAGDLFGAPPPDLIGRSCLDWVHEPDRVEAGERLGSLLGGDDVRATTVRLRVSDGTLRWVEVTGARFTLDDGTTRAVISIRDIGGRLERELDSARSISRSQLMSHLAVEFQTVTPGRFTEAVSGALRELGEAARASVVLLHEIESDGTTVVLRGRWVSPRSGEPERAIAAAHISLAEIPRLRTFLNDRRDLIEVTAAGAELDGELGRIDPSLEVAAIAPLWPGEELLGTVTFGWRASHRVDNDERDLVVGAGKVLGTALERVRAQQALLESEAMFRDLFHGSSAVMYLVDPATLRVVDANAAAATFYGYRREDMIGLDLYRLTIHDRDELAELVESLRAEGATAKFEERQRLADGTVRLVEIHSTPMRIASREFDLAIVQDVTEQRLAHERLERLASTDELTGALNRRRFFQVVGEELERAERYERTAALLMLDLDHFKSVNDELGHLAGDSALVRFADTCREQLRTSDEFARLGGEEFAAFLPETDRAGAVAIAERIRSAAEGTGVTVSVGVAEWQQGMSLDSLYARADKLLYEAKQAGRNRVVA